MHRFTALILVVAMPRLLLRAERRGGRELL